MLLCTLIVACNNINKRFYELLTVSILSDIETCGLIK